jgi:undecaprenyl diphosphate synthase
MDPDKLIKINQTKIPEHIAIIMDGNRRWAAENGKVSMEGHKAGVDTLKRLSIFQTKKSPVKIKSITVYALSEDNKTKREKTEVKSLMRIFETGFLEVAKNSETKKNGIKISVFGKYKTLPSSTVRAIERAVDETKNNNEFFLNFCIAYDGQTEIVEACKKIMLKNSDTKSDIENLKKKDIKQNMYTSEFNAPELIIRTGKERRLSGFMLWDSSYSELYFLDKYWPDVNPEDILDAIINYQNRQRRFGK